MLFETDAELFAPLALGVLISERSVTGVRDVLPRADNVLPIAADFKAVGWVGEEPSALLPYVWNPCLGPRLFLCHSTVGLYSTYPPLEAALLPVALKIGSPSFLSDEGLQRIEVERRVSGSWISVKACVSPSSG